MGKGKEVYTCNGMIFCLKKEGNLGACYNMDQP
jgi:hypothetical protein